MREVVLRDILLFQESSHVGPDVVEHLRRQAAGLGVLAAGMIRGYQPRQAVAQRSKRRCAQRVAAGEAAATDQRRPARWRRTRCGPARPPPNVTLSAKRSPRPGKAGTRPARRRGLVVRRRAAAHGRDVRIGQRQPVVAAVGGRLAGETGPVQRGIQEIARAVAGEHAPGAVGPVRARRQTHDQDARRPGSPKPGTGLPQ